MSAELAARRTAAAAVDADFRKATDAYLKAGTPEPNRSDWAFRLSAEVVSLTTAAVPGALPQAPLAEPA